MQKVMIILFLINLYQEIKGCRVQDINILNFAVFKVYKYSIMKTKNEMEHQKQKTSFVSRLQYVQVYKVYY